MNIYLYIALYLLALGGGIYAAVRAIRHRNDRFLAPYVVSMASFLYSWVFLKTRISIPEYESWSPLVIAFTLLMILIFCLAITADKKD